ncbi:hypothetical protein LFM09_25395 [Lentzea alba]|uniref:hypothetical protein n=1 Tax=Lentzea alba TaxID=2714351 RepID=UPI0039BED49E
MKRLIAAVLCLAATGCGTPAPSSAPASTTVSKPADDSQAIDLLSVFASPERTRNGLR